MATLITDDFVTNLTSDVNTRLAEIARQPIPSTEKLEQAIANEDRQLKRLTERLGRADVTHIDTIVDKAVDMGRQLAEKRERLRELQRNSHKPGVKSVRRLDIVAALGQLRELLQGDVSVVAIAIKALVGDVVIEARQVDGKKRPEMVARFTLNAIPAMAVLSRGKRAGTDDPTVGMWEFLNTDRWIMPTTGKPHAVSVTVPLRRTPKYESMLPQIVEMADAGSGVDLISRALGVSAEVVSDAIHLHRTGKRPPGRVDGRRRRNRTTGQPTVPKYRQIAAEVDRRRKAGEGFDRLAREMEVSRGTILRAYDFANREEAIAAAKEGRKPKRPSYIWSDESRAAKRK